MALDTRHRRSSAIGVGLSFLRVLPPPDGSMAADDRRHLTYCYSGIDAAAASTDIVRDARFAVQRRQGSAIVRRRGMRIEAQ